MGFEYKIIVTLTKEHREKIENILERHILFDKQYSFENKQYWDFRHLDNKEKIPDFTIAFEYYGIYVCKYTNPNLWHDLTGLKEYVASNKIDIAIREE
jgi:hypothetical protein